MHYHVSRSGQTYGPYTLEDLQRYVASGNVLATDLAKSDEMPEWLPVSQILAAGAPPAPTPFSTPGYAAPSYAAPVAYPPAANLAASPYPPAPNLHWGLVVLFSVITCCLGFIFMLIWNLVICFWLRRVQPTATAAFYYVGALVLYVIYFIVGGAAGFAMMGHPALAGRGRYGPYLGARIFIILVIWVLRLVARYSERASLEEHYNSVEPVGLTLDPVMTFFFGGVYFQYHLNRINAMKEAARFGSGPAY